MSEQHKPKINVALVRALVKTQFPQWQTLTIEPVKSSGWDNRTFHLGDDMLVRLPSAADYAAQVAKEQHWLPKLAANLPLQIPEPLAMGQPSDDYPWQWSIYRWLQGETAATAEINNLNEFATSLAEFLIAFHRIETTKGPIAGKQNFYRGGSLKVYDTETRQAIATLQDKLDVKAVTDVWETALATNWQAPPVWVHGDISAGNLLLQDGNLTAVIDFGQLGIGDPACDLAITWTLFSGKSREVFRNKLQLDASTWARARAWTLWKALGYIVSENNDMNFEAKQSWRIIDEVMANHLGED